MEVSKLGILAFDFIDLLENPFAVNSAGFDFRLNDLLFHPL